MQFIGQAPGKLILCGEHAVVEGHAAIAAALPRMTTVTLAERPGPSTLCSDLCDARLWPALLTVVPSDGVEVTIRSELPVGCGLGSSAALAIATLRALAAREGRAATFAELHERGFLIERAFHGNPSGVDHAVSAIGGLVRYLRTPAGPEITPLSLAAPLTLVVVNTGAPAFTTAEMVEHVRQRGSHRELAAIGAIVDELTQALTTPASPGQIGSLLSENHAILRAIGVSTPALDHACEALLAGGALGAKLAGAGGGGVAFGLCTPESAPGVAAEAVAAGLSVFTVTIPKQRPAIEAS